MYIAYTLFFISYISISILGKRVTDIDEIEIPKPSKEENDDGKEGDEDDWHQVYLC